MSLMSDVIQPSVPISVVASGIMMQNQEEHQEAAQRLRINAEAEHDGHADPDGDAFSPHVRH